MLLAQVANWPVNHGRSSEMETAKWKELMKQLTTAEAAAKQCRENNRLQNSVNGKLIRKKVVLLHKRENDVLLLVLVDVFGFKNWQLKLLSN